MGGFGSGNRCRWNAKEVIERQKRLAVTDLKRLGMLQAGFSGQMSWSIRGRQTGSIGLQTSDSHITLNYRARTGQGDWQDISQQVRLDRTACHYGGYRVWLRCPKCDRRISALYGGLYFLCRHCLKLAYTSQNVDSLGRMQLRADRIRERLGWPTGCDTYPRPKGMHHKTFSRLHSQHWSLLVNYWHETDRQIDAMKAALRRS